MQHLLSQMHLESLLVGIIISSGVIFVGQKIADFGSYLNFRRWCDERNITGEDLNKKNFPKYYTMWRLSQLDGIEIVECKDDKDALR